MQEEIREQIIRALPAGLAFSEIFKTLNVSRKTVYNIKNRLLSEGNVKRKPRTNDKCPLTNKAFVAKIKDKNHEELSQDHEGDGQGDNLLEKTVRRVVHESLGAKSRARKRKFLVTQRLKPLSLQKSKKLLWILKKKTSVILFFDKKYFTVDHSTLKVKEVPDGIKSISQTKQPSQVMVFGLLASNGLKMPPVFLPSGFRMGAKEYLDKVLRPHVLPWVQAKFGDDQNYVLMQDGVPCFQQTQSKTGYERTSTSGIKTCGPLAHQT